MKRVRLLIAAVAVAGLGVLGWWLRPGRECRRFSSLMCGYSRAKCHELAQAIEKGLREDRCRDARALLQQLMKVPVQISKPDIDEAFAKAIGAETMFQADERALIQLMSIDSNLAQGMSPIPNMDKLRAIGPPACSRLVARFESNTGDPQKKRIAHQLLVELRGQDLGADAAPWRKWCDDVFKQNLDPK